MWLQLAQYGRGETHELKWRQYILLLWTYGVINYDDNSDDDDDNNEHYLAIQLTLPPSAAAWIDLR